MKWQLYRMSNFVVVFFCNMCFFFLIYENIYKGLFCVTVKLFLFKLLFSEEKKQKGKIHIRFTIYIRIPMSKYNTFSLWVYIDLSGILIFYLMSIWISCRYKIYVGCKFLNYLVNRTGNNCIYKLWLNCTYIFI